MHAKIFMSVQKLVTQYLRIRHKLKTKQCVFRLNTGYCILLLKSIVNIDPLCHLFYAS